MNNARSTGCPPAAMVLRWFFDRSQARYCVPEAGINYKRQMKTQINAGNSCEFLGDELRKRAPVIYHR
jgi:hypothetical protein